MYSKELLYACTLGQCLRELCIKNGATVYLNVKQVILSGIKENLERETSKDESVTLDPQVGLYVAAIVWWLSIEFQTPNYY